MATKFGWCLDGHCLPGPRTGGCPGVFNESGLVCACPCHTGDAPEIAARTLAADQERWAPADPDLPKPVETKEPVSA